MSSHSQRSRSCAPDPKTFEREQFKVGMITFEIIDHPENGQTFALFAGEALRPEDQKRSLFSGHVRKGMGTELRRLAHRFDELERKGDDLWL